MVEVRFSFPDARFVSSDVSESEDYGEVMYDHSKWVDSAMAWHRHMRKHANRDEHLVPPPELATRCVMFQEVLRCDCSDEEPDDPGDNVFMFPCSELSIVVSDTPRQTQTIEHALEVTHTRQGVRWVEWDWYEDPPFGWSIMGNEAHPMRWGWQIGFVVTYDWTEHASIVDDVLEHVDWLTSVSDTIGDDLVLLQEYLGKVGRDILPDDHVPLIQSTLDRLFRCDGEWLDAEWAYLFQDVIPEHTSLIPWDFLVDLLHDTEHVDSDLLVNGHEYEAKKFIRLFDTYTTLSHLMPHLVAYEPRLGSLIRVEDIYDACGGESKPKEPGA
jgi:hypothetical protein